MPGALTPKEIYHKLLPSTCWVVHEERVGSEFVFSLGTGWVVDARRRLIVTNHHVVDGVDVVGVVFPILEGGRSSMTRGLTGTGPIGSPAPSSTAARSATWH